MSRQTARNTMEQCGSVIESQKMEVAREIRERRCLMGLLQKEISEPMEMSISEYSKVEAGLSDGTQVRKFIDLLFEVWREKEIKRLQARIEALKHL